MLPEMPVFNLRKANSEWMLRVLSLSQDYRRHALDAACRYHDEVMARTQAELDRLNEKPAADVVPGAAMELNMRLAAASIGGLLAAGSPMIAAQAAFAQGFAQAFHDWQAAVAQGPAARS